LRSRFLQTKSPVTALTFLPDQRIVCGTNDGSIIIWNHFTEDCLLTVKTGVKKIDSLRVIPNGLLCYSISEKDFFSQRRIFLVNPLNGELIEKKVTGDIPFWDFVGNDFKFLNCGIKFLAPYSAVQLSDNNVIISFVDGSISVFKPHYIKLNEKLISKESRLMHNFKMTIRKDTYDLDIKIFLNSKITNLDLRNSYLSDKLLIDILNHCQFIRILDLRNCLLLTDDSIQALIKHPRIQDVKLENNPYISDDQKIALVKHLSKYKEPLMSTRIGPK